MWGGRERTLLSSQFASSGVLLFECVDQQKGQSRGLPGERILLACAANAEECRGLARTHEQTIRRKLGSEQPFLSCQDEQRVQSIPSHNREQAVSSSIARSAVRGNKTRYNGKTTIDNLRSRVSGVSCRAA